MKSNWLIDTFQLKFPIIMAPMFLVSNKAMLVAAAKSGIMGCIPSLNYKTPEEFEKGLIELKKDCPGAFGVNLIVNQSNIYIEEHIQIMAKHPPHFVITSLGSPKKVIEVLKPLGVKILCDVVDVEYAKKVEQLGADAIIAVNSGAGGHAGAIASSILIPMLKKAVKLPIISAGGVGTGEGLLSNLALGCAGVSIGSPFIATIESPISKEYKDAVVEFGAKDIVMSTKISGTPCSVIATPYVKKIGVEQNFLERLLSKNKNLKKYVKMLTYYKGMKSVENAAFAATYKTVWVAGPSIEFVDKIESVEQIIQRLEREYKAAFEKMSDLAL